MRNLTWHDLMQPAYVLVFIRGFLLAALPAGTLTHTTQNGAAAASTLPGIIAILVAVAIGLVGGLDHVRTLATTPPILKENGR